jgi:hypothetical protein
MNLRAAGGADSMLYSVNGELGMVSADMMMTYLQIR